MFDILSSRIESSDLMKESMNKFKSSIQTFNANAFYMAIVVDTNDSYKLGRVRIRIPAIHGVDSSQSYYTEDDSLPWARPAIWNGAGNDTGQFIVPSAGTRVFVTFEYNSDDKPIYFGGIPTLYNKVKEYNDNPKIFTGDNIDIYTDDRITDLDELSAQQVVYKSIKGATILINDEDTKESIKIIDAAGQQIIMENESGNSLPRRGNNTIPTKGANIKIITAGKLNLDCDTLDLDANNTNLSDYVSAEGTGDKSFIYSQLSASKEWNINHNLNKYPSVTVTDSSGNIVIGDITYIDKNNLIINFSSEFSGKAYLN